MREDWATEILRFWFEELTPDDWYSDAPEAIDKAIRERFLALHEALAADLPPEAREQPEAALAAIIALDQFPRNIFRRQPRAFATDAQAVALARHMLDHDMDAGMPPDHRRFVFMPLMHSEVAADQERCVALFQSVPELAEDVKYAVEHRDIIARFGRFPHRNRVLERESTEAERRFLGEHKGFGQ